MDLREVFIDGSFAPAKKGGLADLAAGVYRMTSWHFHCPAACRCQIDVAIFAA